MTTISNNDIARAIYLLSKGKSNVEQLDISKKVVQFLLKRRIFSKAPPILLQLKKIINQEEGRIVAKVSSVTAFDHKTKTHLEQTLKKRYSAKEIVLIESLDSKLLGGIKVEIDDEVIDLSLKNRIGQLQAHLIKSV